MAALVECVPSCFHLALLFVLQCFFLFMSYTFLYFSTSFICFTLLPLSLHLTLLYVLQCLFLLSNTYSQLFYILSVHLALPPSYFHLTLFDLKAMSFVILKLCSSSSNIYYEMIYNELISGFLITYMKIVC